MPGASRVLLECAPILHGSGAAGQAEDAEEQAEDAEEQAEDAEEIAEEIAEEAEKTFSAEDAESRGAQRGVSRRGRRPSADVKERERSGITSIR